MPSVCFSDIDMTYYDYDVNRITDNFGRYTRLSDVLEEDSRDYSRINNMSSSRRRYSSTGSSSSSMDHLWELYPHRLREAVFSRYTDSSAVLTEDTDSFIIGQRVWVGGSKPGTIAFIGETQFAPGEWAGIALDEAIGKNDGAVAGIRYFQCEPKKGVFSRLTRLTRVPLEEPHNRSNDNFSTPNGLRSPISPTSSTRSLLKSPISHYASNTSLASTSTSHIIDYKLGDRVIIKSSQGSKVGTVRYIGYTEFAPGEWVGVELDDPRGKNDGSVEGKRYFACQSNFGLFAPVNKVSKSPSKVKPGACSVHTPGLPPSGMRKAGSKESLASATSSVRRVRLGVNSLTPQRISSKASTPSITRPSLQDLMKEKQQQIEQLMKERDLERQEFTKAASQVEEAEEQLNVLKTEFDAYRSECEIKLQEHMTLLKELKKDRSELAGQLEDEKKKNEDLLFKFEEAAIIQSDLEVMVEKKAAEIKELGTVLEIEKARMEDTEKNVTKLFEAEENLIKANEEIDKLKSVIETLTIEKRSLNEETVITKDKADKVQEELDITKKQFEELNNIRNDLSQKLTALNLEHAELKSKSDKYEENLQSAEVLSAQKNTEYAGLKTELDTTKNLLAESQKKLEEVSSLEVMKEANFNKENEKLKIELSAKSFDLENLNEELKKKVNENEFLTKNTEEMKIGMDDLTVKNKEIIDKLNKELEELNNVLKMKNEEITRNEQALEEQSSSLNKQIQENAAKTSEYQNTIELLKKDVDNLKNYANASTNELQQQIIREQEVSLNQIEQLKKDLKNKDDEIGILTSNNASVHKELSTITEESKKVSLEFESLKLSFDSLTKESTKLKEEKQQFELANGDLTRNIDNLKLTIEDMENQKNKMNEEIQTLMHSSGDHGKKLEEMHKNLIEKQSLLDQTKQEYQEKLQLVEHELQQQIIRQKEKEEEISKLQNELESARTSLQQMENDNKKQINDMNEEINKIKEESSLENAKIQNLVNAKDSVIEQQTKEINDIEIKLKQQIEKNKSYVDDIVKTYNEQVNTLGEQNKQINEQLKTEKELKKKLQEEYKEKLSCLIKDVEESKGNSGLVNDENEELKKKVLEYEEKISCSDKNINELKDKTNQICEEKEKLMNDIESLRSELEAKLTEIIDLKNVNNEKEALLVKQLGEIQMASSSSAKETLEKINSLSEKNTELQNELNVKNKEIELLNLKFKEFVDQNEKNVGEKEHNYLKTIADLDTQMKQKNANLFEMSTKIVSIEKDLQQKNSEIHTYSIEKENVLKKVELFEEKMKMLEKENGDLKKTLDISNKNSLEKDQQHINIDAELTLLRQNCDLVERALKEEKNKNENLLAEITAKQNSEQNTCKNLENELELSKKHFEELSQEREHILHVLKQLQFTQKQKADLVQKGSQYQNNSLKEIFLSVNDTYTDESLNKIEDLERSLQISRKQNEQDKEVCEKLKNEINNLKQQLKCVQELPSRERTEDADDNTRQLNNNAQSDYQQLLEDKVLAENQVKFLNSIIVDMQKKNVEQQAKIEILESGFSPAAAEELNILGYSSGSRQLAPRVYCDICDRFDEHETEDCPQQMSQDMPAPPPPDGKKKAKPAPRPYCELCEVFGHDTQDCPEDDTF